MTLLQCTEELFELTYPQSVFVAKNAASFTIRTAPRYPEKALGSIFAHCGMDRRLQCRPERNERLGSWKFVKTGTRAMMIVPSRAFNKSSRRSSAPTITKLPPRSFTTYSDSRSDTPCVILGFPGLRDGLSSYPGRGDNHGYHSSTSSPGVPSAPIHSLDLFLPEGGDQLPML